MYDIAEHVQRWLGGGRRVQVAQVVASRGFSSREPAAGLAWTDEGESVGALFPGLDDDLIATGSELAGRLVERTLSDVDAVRGGLSCGGVASILVHDAGTVPDHVWSRLARHEPLCLVSVIRPDDHPITTHAFTPTDVRDAAQIPGAHDVPRLFARGMSATALIATDDTSVAAVTLWPPTNLLVVGDGNIARALLDVAALLGWGPTVVNDAASAVEAAGSLTESDAVVVLSHDRAVDVPALAAVLAGRVGYVGGLGSRGTQTARRDGLIGRGTSADQLHRIHGPAGLDIDAHTPAEIAVSIIAEVIASRSGSSGGSISRRGGPVHTGGVHAPPPRYGH
jgi:xanthine dehydrogenase accessory factor